MDPQALHRHNCHSEQKAVAAAAAATARMTAEVFTRNGFDMAGAAAAIANSSSGAPKRLQQRIAEELRVSYLTPSGGGNEGNSSSNGHHGSNSGSKTEDDADDAQILAEYILHLLLREKAPTDRLLEELKEFLGQPVSRLADVAYAAASLVGTCDGLASCATGFMCCQLGLLLTWGIAAG